MPGGWVGHDRLAHLPPDWAERKKLVWARDGDICWLCGQPGADTIDHKRRGDDHELENLGPVHDRRYPHCHRYKSSWEGNEARRRIRTRGKRPAERHPGLL